MYGSISSSIPKVGYLKMMDLWMLLCICLICFAMAEFVILNAIQVGAGGPDQPVPGMKSCTSRKLFTIVDRISAFLYILAFVAFFLIAIFAV